MMGRLVRLVRGEWQRSATGEWDFKIDPDESSYGVMVQENEKLKSLIELVTARYQIQDVVVLTYQFPPCLLEPEGKKTLPLDISEDGDVALFMAVRLEHIEMPLCVTVGAPAIERYRFQRRSAFDMVGLPHVFGETSLSLGGQQPSYLKPTMKMRNQSTHGQSNVPDASTYWDALMATGTVPFSLSCLDNIMSNDEADSGEDDRSSTDSSDGPNGDTPTAPEKSVSTVHKWMDENTLGTTIENLSYRLSEINDDTQGITEQNREALRTTRTLQGTSNKGKEIATSDGCLGGSSTDLMLGSKLRSPNDLGLDPQIMDLLLDGHYGGGFVPASVGVLEEIFNQKEMARFKRAGVNMLKSIIPTIDDLDMESSIPNPVDGVIRLIDGTESEKAQEGNVANVVTITEEATRCRDARTKTTINASISKDILKPTETDKDKSLDCEMTEADERELMKLGFINASMTVLEELLTPVQIQVLKDDAAKALEMVKARNNLPFRAPRSHDGGTGTKILKDGTDIEMGEPSNPLPAEMDIIETEDSEGVTEIQAMSSPVCFKPANLEMDIQAGAKAKSETDAYNTGGDEDMETDAADSDDGFTDGFVRNNPMELYVGMMFKNREGFRKHMALYALAHKFRFRNKKSNPGLMILECVGRCCPWRVYAVKMPDSDYFQVRRVRPDHMCTANERVEFERHASTEVIGDMMKTRFAGRATGPRPSIVRDIMRDGHDTQISYWKAWKSRELALDSSKGSSGDSFNMLPKYLSLLVMANPGTLVFLETDYIAGVGERFKYLFFALAASIAGFQFMRKVIIVDGTFLKSKYAGCLITASCQDGNYQIYPVGFGVVDGENERSYTWFFNMLLKVVPDSEDLVFISDRHNAIITALRKVYPKSKHCSCIIHLQRNIQTIFKKRHLSYLVSRAGRAYRVAEFAEHFNEIANIDRDCAEYLTNIGLHSWTRSHSTARRFNLMTSNIAESLNAALAEARDYPIVPLVDFIRATLMGWFHVRREIALKLPTTLTPRIQNIISKKFEVSTGFEVRNINAFEFEVRNKEGIAYHVDLGMKTCSCYEFQMLCIPCTHAVAAAMKAKVEVDTLVTEEFRTECWRKGYAGSIYPVPPNDDEEGKQNDREFPELLPPLTRRPPGRPRKKRFLSRGEIVGPRQRKVKVCSRCRGVGHNRATCKNPI